MPAQVDLVSWRSRLNSSLGRIAVAVGLLLLLLAFNVQLLLRLEYQAEVEQIQTDAERSAQKLAAHTSAVLDRGAQSLALLSRLHEAAGAGRQLPHAAELLGSEGLEAWLVTDANGLVIESSGKVPASVASTAFFRRASKLEPGALDLGETEVLPGADKRPVLPLTRRLSGPRGEFLGSATALIGLTQLISPEVRHEASGTALTLTGQDGRVRVRFHEDRFTHGELLDLPNLRKRLAAAHELLEPLPSRLDGQLRFVSVAELPRYPAVATVGLRAETVLTSYQGHRLRILLTAAMAALVLLGAGFLLFMQSRRLKASRHRLRAAEARLRATLDGSLDAVLVMRAERDAKGVLSDLLVIDANARAAALLDVREPIGQRFSELLPAARESGILQEFELAMASSQTMVSERLGHSPHLVDHWLQHQIVPLEDGVALFSRDISERYNAERIQSEQRRFLQNLLDVLPLAVYAKSARPATMGRYLFWNHAAERCFGMTAEQVVGHTVHELFAPADAARFDAQFAQVLTERRPRRFADQQSISGGRQYFDILKVPVLADDGQIDHLLVVAEDVTEKRGSAERLRLGSRVLAETADAVLICDANDCIIDCNPAFGHLTGHHIAALQGRPVSAAGLPLFDGGPDGDAARWVGESRLVCSDGRVLDIWLSVNRIHDGEGQLTHHARVFSDISALKRHQAELDEMARLDSLTGLPNRRSFDERLPEALARAGRHKQLMALLFVDLDGFKKVNDTLGHAAGDQLLCAVAERLKACVRTVDAVCRLGGDEFTVIVEDAGSQADVGKLCERILEMLSQPHLLAAGRPVVTPSVGVALATPGEAPDSLLRRADDAMYAAKRAGKARYCVARPLEP